MVKEKESLVDRFLKSPSLEQFTKLICKEPSLLIEQLWDTAKAILICLMAKSTGKHILLISSNSQDRLLDDLSYFSLAHVVDFPSWDTLPGEQIAPSPDLIGKRLQVLHSLLTLKTPHVILAPLQAALQKLPTPQTLLQHCYLWNKGATLDFASLPGLLETLGFVQRPVVSDKGDFAIRGGILDLFPPSSTDPFRLEFFGDTLDEIRTFDPISQKSTGKCDQLFLSPASEIALMQKQPGNLCRIWV